MELDTISEKLGFKVLDHSRIGSKKFWATIVGTYNIPYTIKADQMDLDDFAMTMDACTEYVHVRHFFADLSAESWEGFVYLFVDHLIQHERNKGAEYRMRLAVMGRIFEIIKWDSGDAVTEFYTHANFKVAGYTLNIYARRVEERENYKNHWGHYRVWIESDQITDMDGLLKCYADIAMNNVLRGSKN